MVTCVPRSARNQLVGTVTSIETPGVVAEVAIELGNGQTITSVITSGSVDRLRLHEADEVSAVVKATEVMVQPD